MTALNTSVGLKNIEIFTDGDLRGAELFGQVHDQNASVAIQNVENMSAPLFVQHRSIRQSRVLNAFGWAFPFYRDCFRLSTAGN
jgi:hypothetical protein